MPEQVCGAEVCVRFVFSFREKANDNRADGNGNDSGELAARASAATRRQPQQRQRRGQRQRARRQRERLFAARSFATMAATMAAATAARVCAGVAATVRRRAQVRSSRRDDPAPLSRRERLKRARGLALNTTTAHSVRCSLRSLVVYAVRGYAPDTPAAVDTTLKGVGKWQV